MSISKSQGFKNFRSWVAQQKINLGYLGNDRVWTYYDWGPRDVEPLICIPGVSGTAEGFFRQTISLCPRGYRVISVQPPPYMDYTSWMDGFDRFLDFLEIPKAHLLGTSLGGYLAQCYMNKHPNKVASLILQNSYCSTSHFQNLVPSSQIFIVFPTFMLQKFILSSFPTIRLEPNVADSVDFMVQQLETLNHQELVSRLRINCTPGPFPAEPTLDQTKITIIDTLDEVAIPDQLREEVYRTYPNAKVAYIKAGGNFPFLAIPDEFNMHIIVHLRNHGVFPSNGLTTSSERPMTTTTTNSAPTEIEPC